MKIPSYLSKEERLKILSQFSLWNLLNLNALLKLLFIYLFSVFVIIICYFDFSPGIFSNKTKIAIYSSSGRIGENQAYLKSLRALKKMDIEYIGCSLSEAYMNYFLTRPFYQTAIYIMHKIVKPKFSIALTHHVSIVPPGYSLVYLNVPDLQLFGNSGKFVSIHNHLRDFDGYIDLYSLHHGSNKYLDEVLVAEERQNALVIPAYLAQDLRELQLPESYNHAVLTGTLWGCSRSSYRFISALKKLSTEDLIKAYGMKYAYHFLGKSYKGSLEKYGKPIDSIMEVQREGGISLISHNFEHLVQGLPTSRFAESFVAGSVLISDRHPFIEKHFEDNVLYFDPFASGDEIYKQIRNHILWIKAHPEKARQMSKNAYNIFAKKFALEIQLALVIKHVESFLKNAKI